VRMYVRTCARMRARKTWIG